MDACLGKEREEKLCDCMGIKHVLTLKMLEEQIFVGQGKEEGDERDSRSLSVLYGAGTGQYLLSCLMEE